MRIPLSPFIAELPRDTFERVDAVLALVGETQGSDASNESTHARSMLIEACREALAFEVQRGGTSRGTV